MTTEFGEMKDVIVTPEMLNRYFFMNKTEILVHLFLLSVCDSNRHVERNVRALARETERWHPDVYQALIELTTKSMVEEKKLKTKGGRFWRVYHLPRTRKVNGEEDCSPPNSQSEFTSTDQKKSCASPKKSVEGEKNFSDTEKDQKINDHKNSDMKNSKGFWRYALEKLNALV